MKLIKKAQMNTVTVNIDFIKEAYNAACKDWKRRLVDEFPEIEFNSFKKGVLIESNESSLVVYVTKDCSDGVSFNGIAVREDNKYPIGFCSNEWAVKNGHIYQGTDIDVKKILTL